MRELLDVGDSDFTGDAMRVYIAGPYTKGDVGENVREAVNVGDIVASEGHTVFIPHLTHFWHIIHNHSYEFWMKQDEEWLKCCDALVRIDGESAGADKEVALAHSLGIPVYHSPYEFLRSIK